MSYNAVLVDSEVCIASNKKGKPMILQWNNFVGILKRQILGYITTGNI